MQGEWGPEYFKNYYGLQSVTVIDCDTNEELKSTVADFFEIFGSPKPQRRMLKIKACSFYVMLYPL
jgi:lysine-specific demethylase 3